MMKYKNLGMTTKKFYGVTFAPKSTHEVPGYINDPWFIVVKDEKTSMSDESKSESKPEPKVPSTTKVESKTEPKQKVEDSKTTSETKKSNDPATVKDSDAQGKK